MMIQTDNGNKLTGFFRGEVIKHLPYGKCKVYIPGVYAKELRDSPDSLPDAEQAAPIFGGNFGGNGVFSYPNIGSIVWCFFANEDQNYPVFFATTQGEERAKNQYDETRNDTRDTSIKSGDDARAHKIRTDLASITMSESGHIKIKVYNDRKYALGKEIPEVGCQIDIDETGTINIFGSKQIHFKTPDMVIEADQYTLKCQTMKVNSGNQIDMYSGKVMKLGAKNQMDFTSVKENHCNNAFTETTSGNIRIDGDFVQIQGSTSTHKPIFL